MNVSNDALFQNCINGSPQPDRGAARAQEEETQNITATVQ